MTFLLPSSSWLLKLPTGSFGHLPFFLQAHTSSVSHLDWSKDGEKLQSTSTDYELLFCKGKLYFDPACKYTIVVKENTCYPSVYFFFCCF